MSMAMPEYVWTVSETLNSGQFERKNARKGRI